MSQYTEDCWVLKLGQMGAYYMLDCGDWCLSCSSFETAICIDGKYYILTGDWRTELTPLAHSKTELLQFFLDHQDEASGASDYPQEVTR